MRPPKIDMEFGNLPNWTIDELKNIFGKTTNGSKFIDFSEWQYELKNYTRDLPKDQQLQFLIKGIEYNQKVIDKHNESCLNKGNCKVEETWLRKISIAKKLLSEMEPAQIQQSPIILPKIKFAGSKIDLIRILNALYELKQIEDLNGIVPTKLQFMKDAGEFFSVDLSDYDSSLSQAFKISGLEANLSIFDQMKEKTQKIYHKKLEDK